MSICRNTPDNDSTLIAKFIKSNCKEKYTNLKAVKLCAFSIVDVWIPVKFKYSSHHIHEFRDILFWGVYLTFPNYRKTT